MWREERVRSSANPLRELFDAAVKGYAIKLRCLGCQREACLDAHAVWHLFRRRGFSERLGDVPAKFVCSGCRRRSPQMTLVHEEPTSTSLPMPSAQDWKRELSRRR